MKLLVNVKTNVVVFMSNHIEPHDQGFFVGDVIWPDPEKTLAVFEVEDASCKDVKSTQYCYTAKKGFFLNPAYASNDYVVELEQVKSELAKLQQELAEAKAIIEASKATEESAPAETPAATE